MSDPRTAYERIARRYAGDSPAEDDPSLREACRRLFIERLPGRRVLEVGCGPGTDAAAFAALGLAVLATDIASEFTAVVRERWPELPVAQMDMTRPALRAARFDGIWAFASFIHVERAVAPSALRALRELLVPGGILFLGLVASDRHREYVIPDWGGVPENALLFVCWRPEEIEALLLASGFARVSRFAVRSEVYEKLPRLVERGVTLYQLIATR